MLTANRFLVSAFCFLVLLCQPLFPLAQQYDVIHLGGQVNTVGSETGAVVLDDTLMLYASHGVGDHDLMQLRLASIDSLGRPVASRLCPGPLNNRKSHTGNAAYDARHSRLFFTRCEADDTGAIQCALWVVQRRHGRWQRPRRLGGDVNRAGATNTHPAVGYQADGSTLLYFASDRDGGLGGMDIWYAVVRDEVVGRCVNLGTPVNSSSDEITPYYDTVRCALYFSSDREGGRGGYDIYRSEGGRDGWKHPEALPEPLNSGYNDLYFTLGTLCGCWGYLASNREDSFFSQDSSCCNDLYRWRLLPADTAKTSDSTGDEPQSPQIMAETDSVNPASEKSQLSILDPQRSTPAISLFFHNDEPGAGSWSDTTEVAYFQTYNRYMFMRDTYLDSYRSAGDSSAVRQVNAFFDEVRRNCDRYEQLMEYMLDDLQAGRRVEITLQGYASTPHTGAYNLHLSSRRIVSIVNQLRQWRGGVLSRYLADGTLSVRVLPYGSRHAAVVPDNVDPVFSVEMARERRVEIIGYRCW